MPQMVEYGATIQGVHLRLPMGRRQPARASNYGRLQHDFFVEERGRSAAQGTYYRSSTSNIPRTDEGSVAGAEWFQQFRATGKFVPWDELEGAVLDEEHQELLLADLPADVLREMKEHDAIVRRQRSNSDSWSSAISSLASTAVAVIARPLGYSPTHSPLSTPSAGSATCLQSAASTEPVDAPTSKDQPKTWIGLPYRMLQSVGSAVATTILPSSARQANPGSRDCDRSKDSQEAAPAISNPPRADGLLTPEWERACMMNMVMF